MTTHECPSRSRRFGPPRTSLMLLAITLLMLNASASAAIAVSTFDIDADGWIGLACPNPGICALGAATLSPDNFKHVATGGNPGGYIDTVDPSSDTAGRAQAPDKFLDNLAVGLTLSFDALITDPDDTGEFDALIAPLATFEGNGKTLVYSVPASDFPIIDGPWKHYDVHLAPGLGWSSFLDSDPVNTLGDASADDFADVFGNPERLTLISEWLNDAADLDTGGIDSVRLVPVPAALPLMATVLAALGARARLRRAAPAATAVR